MENTFSHLTQTVTEEKYKSPSISPPTRPLTYVIPTNNFFFRGLTTYMNIIYYYVEKYVFLKKTL